MTTIPVNDMLVHTHGTVWYLDRNQQPRDSTMQVGEFLESKTFSRATGARVMGAANNIPLILRLYDRKVREKLRSVQLVTPLACRTNAERRKPENVLYRMRHYCRPPSLGGYHEITEADYRAYALAHLVGNNTNALVDAAALRMLRIHPAWRALSFIESLNKHACAKLLAHILDPRWFIDECHPDRASKLENYLGLNPKTQAGVSSMGAKPWRHHARCACVLNCWKAREKEHEVRSMFELTTPQPVEGSALLGAAPYDFAWRVWGLKLGIGINAKPDTTDPVKADLRASQRFVLFLRQTWISALYDSSAALPDQGASLFRPADFFKHPTEIAAYEMHQLSTDNSRQ